MLCKSCAKKLANTSPLGASAALRLCGSGFDGVDSATAAWRRRTVCAWMILRALCGLCDDT